MTFDRVQLLGTINSPLVPKFIEHHGKRMEWTGIGWIDLGEPEGDEVLIT